MEKVSRKAMPLLMVFHHLNGFFGKFYCFPSQEKLCELLVTFCSLGISRRQLNYDLKSLEDHGIIRRVRRHRRTKHRGMEFRSTLYEISYLGYNLLQRAGVITWQYFKEVRARFEAKMLEKKKPCAKIDAHGDLTSISEVLADVLH